MTKPMKISGSVNKTFNLGASTKKSSADQKFSQNRCRRIIGRRRPIFQNFARRPSVVLGFLNEPVQIPTLGRPFYGYPPHVVAFCDTLGIRETQLLVASFPKVLLKPFELNEGWYPVNWFNHTSCVAIVTPTDRSKSVRNRCVIEVFGDVFVLFFRFRVFCWCRGFSHGSESGLLFSLPP